MSAWSSDFPRAKTGVHAIAPAGEDIQVFCNMVFDALGGEVSYYNKCALDALDAEVMCFKKKHTYYVRRHVKSPRGLELG